MKTCTICNTDQSKYRCPKCNTEYCSLKCFKTHKSTNPEETGGCQPVVPSVQPNVKTKNDRFENKKRRRNHTIAEPIHVSPEDLKRLKTSEPVLKAAKSSQLQEVVRSILEANDPHKALQKRLENDTYFSSFADDIMIAIGKAERTSDGNVMVL